MADERYIDEFAKEFANGIVEGQLSERARIVKIVKSWQSHVRLDGKKNTKMEEWRDECIRKVLQQIIEQIECEK